MTYKLSQRQICESLGLAFLFAAVLLFGESIYVKYPLAFIFLSSPFLASTIAIYYSARAISSAFVHDKVKSCTEMTILTILQFSLVLTQAFDEWDCLTYKYSCYVSSHLFTIYSLLEGSGVLLLSVLITLPAILAQVLGFCLIIRGWRNFFAMKDDR